MEKVLVLVENKKTKQFAFLSICPDSFEELQKQLGKGWEARVLRKHVSKQAQGGPKDNG